MLINGKQISLTQDWAPGDVKITVAQFESNIAGGTPPLVVASNTRVPNLNADLLDGVEASAFPLLAGRSGGQTLIGGTASGNDLTLQSTSHATKGKILFGTSAYDDVNNRLGIGTASPSVPLHVVGNALITGLVGVGVIDSNFEFNVQGSGNINLAIQTTGATETANIAFITPERGWDIGTDGDDGNFTVRDRDDTFAQVLSIRPGAGANAIKVTSVGRVGFGLANPLGKVGIDQSSATAGIPVLVLDQADVSEPMLRYISVAGTGRSIEVVGSKTLTTTHFIKTQVNGLVRYIEVGTIA